MTEYLGKIHSRLHDFNELLPRASTPSQELQQPPKFFMLLDLHGLSYDYFHFHDQILGSPILLNFISTCSTILCVPSKPIDDILAFIGISMW